MIFFKSIWTGKSIFNFFIQCQCRLAMDLFLILVSTQFGPIFCQWYRGEAIQKNSTSVEIKFDRNSRKTFSTKSRTECILKCRNQLIESYFVEIQEQCFCLKELEKVAENATNSKDDGILYKQVSDLEPPKETKVILNSLKNDFKRQKSNIILCTFSL